MKAIQNGAFLPFRGKAAFEDLQIFEKEAWEPSNRATRFSIYLFYLQ